MRFRKKIELTSEFFIQSIKMPYIKNQIDSSLGSTTVGHFIIVKAKKILMHLPPIQLQTQFAETVQKIEEQKALVQKAIDETQALFDSLMNEYFE